MFQNKEDQKTFNDYSNYQGQTYIIPTSGITVKDIEIKNDYQNSNLKVIMATRLIKDKGIFEYLELAKSMKNTNFEFYLAGDVDKGNPDSLSEVELDKIKKNSFVHYLGHIDISKELCNFDINIVMSKYEGSSRILLESLYVGLICSSNNIPGTREFSSKFSNTFFIEDNNIQEFERNLNEISNSNVIFEDFAKHNRELIIENYTSEKIASAYNKIYQYLREDIESYKSEFN